MITEKEVEGLKVSVGDTRLIGKFLSFCVRISQIIGPYVCVVVIMLRIYLLTSNIKINRGIIKKIGRDVGILINALKP